MNFTKMHGNGNDFIIIDDQQNKYVGREAELAKKLCNRNFFIGADGILIVRKSEVADIKMIIMNSDGSYASMCGNGIRCFAKYVWDKRIILNNEISIETGDGVKIANLELKNEIVENVKIFMGKPSFIPMDVPVLSETLVIDKKFSVNDKEYNITTMIMGVPHTVILGKLEDFDIYEGKAIEKHSMFPIGTNVNFCEVVSRSNIRVKTWERGAGPTLACGTGSCASVVAVNKLGKVDKKVHVELPGGYLFIELNDEGVYMSGPAVTVFEGEYLE